VDDQETINIYDYNETYIQLDSDPSVMAEIREYFTFEAKNARFHPKFKAKQWDGRIRLLSAVNNTIYKGLIPYIKDFCDERGYNCEIDPAILKTLSENIQFDIDHLLKYVDPVFPPYEYQKKAIEHAIKSTRCLLLSPTSSGKSFIIYLMMRHYLSVGLRVLLVVPSTHLVEQMVSDFKEYQPSFDIDYITHKIYDGADKLSHKPLTVSTWQSIVKQPKKYFNDNYDVIIVDEAHNYKGEEVRKVLESADQVKYKFGLTGTLDDVDIHRFTIEGLLGKSFTVTTTSEMIGAGLSSDISIKPIVLEYDQTIRASNKKFEYKDEVEFVIGCQKRTSYISKLALQLAQKNTNTLILADRVEHVESLYNEISKYTRRVYKVTGSVDVKERERIRKLVESEDGIILIATYGTFSTGVNIKNIQNIIFAFAGKAYIRTLQSIGRGLRLDGKSNKMTLYDFIDDFGFISKNGKKANNYIYEHGIKRLSIYMKSKFKFNIVKIKI